MNELINITIALLILFLISIIINFLYKKINKLNYNFYDYKFVYPHLEILKINRNLLMKDLKNIKNIKWENYPEKDLYNIEEKKDWKIFPFKGFDIILEKNCKLCPNICDVLKKIPNLSTASISKLTPGTKLKPHNGFGETSNENLRCHYVLESNDNSFLQVNNERKILKDNDIIVFDDSKLHYAENNGNSDRIVLLLDILRPYYVVKGEGESKGEEMNLVVKEYISKYKKNLLKK